MSLSVGDLAGQYHQAWAIHDTDAIAALHTPDSVFHIHGATDAATGRASVRDLVATFLELLPNLRFASKRAYLVADHIGFEYDMSGTVNGADFTWRRCDRRAGWPGCPQGQLHRPADARKTGR